MQTFINIIVKFSRDVVFSQLPDQFSQVALDAAANKKILHNGESAFVARKRERGKGEMKGCGP